MKKQSCKMNFFISIFAGLMVLTLLAGCAAPPTQKLADAQAALEKAKAAGAEIYAKADYTDAQKQLNEALALNEKAFYYEAARAAKGAIAAAQKAEKAGSKAKAGAKREANFEAAALQSGITTAQGLIANAKKQGAKDKDLAEALSLLETAQRLNEQVQSMLKYESYASAKHLATSAQKKAEEAGSKAFVALQNAKKAAEKAKARALAYAKREANFEVQAAGAAIRSAENLVNKAAGTKRAGAAELSAAKTQLFQAKAIYKRAEDSLKEENFQEAKEQGILARELAEAAGSSAFKAIAMSKKPAK